MRTDEDIKSLHPLEVTVLRRYDAADVLSASALQRDLGLNVGQSNQALSWLAARDSLQEHNRSILTRYEITDLGRDYAEHGTPEERVQAAAREHGPLPLPRIAELTELPNKDVGSAFGKLSKLGILGMDGEKQVSYAAGPEPSAAQADIDLVRALLRRAAAAPQGLLEENELSDDERRLIGEISKKRGASGAAFRVVESEIVEYTLTESGMALRAAVEAAGLSGEEVGALTPAMLRDGSWKGKSFRSYSIHVPPSRLLIGRRNPYCSYLDQVKDKLVSLGFEEFDGPLVETEFWNSDALFMPQFHSARDIHDVYYVADPTHAQEIQEPFLSRVAATHEDGWETGSSGWDYGFDRDFTRRLILRSQGTVMSAKTLHQAKVPGKYFGILRCFRYDQVDATHLSDFYQTEGIVLGEDVNLRTLMGMLEMFAVELAGATDVKCVPGYFPFTEPSVEIHIKHPELGWFELGGAGIFRPEVTEPMGVSVPVLAWGLGIDRMALMHLGLNDLRELFSPNIENVRLRTGKQAG